MPPPGRLLAGVAALPAGAVAGLLGSFAHRYAPYGLPAGLCLAVGLTAAVYATAGLGTRSRLVVGAAVAGWLLAVLPLTVRRPEGDLVVAQSWLGLVWLFGGVLLAGLALGWPYDLLGRDEPRSGSGPDPVAAGPADPSGLPPAGR
jgi:hypothetical protein